jgi:hypothetical protein
MGLSNLSFSATNVNAGNDADKPVLCKVGDQYIATDTNILYVCFSNNVWSNATPPVTELMTINAIPGLDTELINDLTEYSKSGGSSSVYQTIKSYTIENISGLSNIEGFYCQYQYRSTDVETRSRILVNGVSIWESGSTTSQSYQTVEQYIMQTLEIGDIIEFQVWGANSVHIRYVQNIKISIGYYITGDASITTS